MKDADLGLDKDGAHDPKLTPLENKCLEILCKGKEKAVSAADLTVALALKEKDGEKMEHDIDLRGVRRLINHLIITHAIPVICKAGHAGGYFIAEIKDEVDEFYETYRKRAMTGLLKASRGRKAAFVEMIEQLSFGFDEKNRAIEKLRLLPEEEKKPPAWVDLVTKFLDRIAQDPQKHAAEIRRIQKNYGDIFVPREKVMKLREKTSEFQNLLNSL